MTFEYRSRMEMGACLATASRQSVFDVTANDGAVSLVIRLEKMFNRVAIKTYDATQMQPS